MRRLLLSLISFSLAAVLAMPVPAMALPSAVAATPGGVGELVVTWDQSGDGTVVDYLVELDQSGGSNVVAQAGPLTTTFNGLSNGVTYNITVTARDAGQATVGTPASGSGTTIAAPSVTTVTATANGATVIDASWVADDGGGTNTYSVSVSPADAATQPGVTGLSTSFTGLTAGVTYTVTVTPTNEAGPGTANFDTATTVGTASVSSVSASASGPNSINVSWVADDGGGTNTYAMAISPADAATQTGITGTTGSFGGLNPNVEYTITVTPTNEAGTGSANSGTATTDVDAASVAVTATAGGADTVNASWTFDDGGGTNTYAASISPADAPAQSGLTTASTSFTGLTAGVTYTITVTPTNEAGAGTADSDTATTGFGAASVTSVTAVAVGAIGVNATWVADDGGGTNTYVASISPADAPAQTGLTGTSAAFTGLTPGVTYTVTVTPTNEAGAGTANSDTATTIGTASVTSVSASANGSTGVNATWVANDGGGTNTYVASISPADAATQTGLTGTSAAFTGLTPGVTYTVTVTPTNEAGAGTAGSDSATTAAVAASAPTGVTAALGGAFDNFVTVNWTAPSNTGGSAITGYIVTLSNGDSITVNDGAATSTTFETVSAGTSVTAQVRAVTAAGNGASSSASNSVRTSSVPDSVTVVAGEWAGSSNINAINVSWNAPSSTGGLPLTGYVIEVTPPLENPIPVVDPGETTVVIGGLEQGTTYTVTVQAQNARGNSVGQTSGNVLVPSTPGTVTDLVVQQSPPFSSGVVLTWALPEEDGGSPITGYSIVVDERDPLIVGPLVTTASFTDLPVGDHNVTVQAITAAGNGATVTSPNFEVKAFAPFDSEEEFVTQLYTDFLRRTPDAGGLAFWTERVADDGSNVQEIVEAFMRSPEFSPRRSVARLYFAYFNRQPDKGGFDFWTRQISSGAAVLENASQAFAQSPEFNETYGDLNDAEFIVLVYNNVLARRPEQGGFEFWLDQLTDGLPRGTMMTLFSESPENIPLSQPAVDVTVTYDGMLQREADVEGFRFWTGRVSSENTGLTELIRQFYFSLEYADRVNR